MGKTATNKYRLYRPTLRGGLLLWLLLPLWGWSQKKPSLFGKKVDSSYIQSYYHELDLGTQFGSQYMEYRTYYNDTFFISIRPNEVYTLSPSINYRWLSVSYAFTPEFLEFNNDDSLRGSTRFRRLSTSFSFGQLSLSGIWSTTRGFYLANMADVYPTWKPGQPYLQFPEMEVKRFILNGVYRTNPNFSIKAINGGEEEQLRSAWTFLPGLNIMHFKFNVPNGDPQQAGTIELTNNTDINIVLPIAGTWVFARHAYISAAAGPIMGVDFFRSFAIDENNKIVESNGIRFSTGFHLGLNIGYNQPNWYIGLSNLSSSYRHGVSNAERMAKLHTQFALYGGVRIKPPKMLKKSLDWAEKILPFLK
jgi:hypothetical protein